MLHAAPAHPRLQIQAPVVVLHDPWLEQVELAAQTNKKVRSEIEELRGNIHVPQEDP